MKMWRPEKKEWEKLIKEVIKARGITAPYPLNLVEVGADAMHKADIDKLRKHIISKPTDRFVVISIHQEEWAEFTRGG